MTSNNPLSVSNGGRHISTRHVPALACTALLSLTSTASAQQSDQAVADEVTLARSAAPPEVSANASVYVLRDGVYLKHISGSNGFTCLVLPQDEPGAREPVCLDLRAS